MVQIKHFTALQKMPNFPIFKTCKLAMARKKYLTPPSGQKIIVNQSKTILVIASVKPFFCQSFRQNYFSREIERAVFTKTAF